jgi:hypothetical protein
MGKRNYEEAEPLLISGYEGMRQRESGIRERYVVLEESIQTVIQLYEGTSRFEKAAEWRAKLTMLQTAGSRGKMAWPKFSEDDQNVSER